jgi:hypothetical protein
MEEVGNGRALPIFQRSHLIQHSPAHFDRLGRVRAIVRFSSEVNFGATTSRVYRQCSSHPPKPSIEVLIAARFSIREVDDGIWLAGFMHFDLVARPFGSENDKYVCVGECRVVRMCLLQYCYNETVCNPCARVVVVIGRD